MEAALPHLPRIQNHCVKSGKLWFFLTNSGSVYEPLMGGSFCVGNEVGIEVLAKPIFVRGVSPFYGSAPRTLQWLARPMPGRRTLRLTELDGLRNLPQKFHSAFYIGAEKEKKTNLGTRAKTRQSAAQTSIRADARAGIIQWRICPVARRHEAEYQRRYGAFWRRVRIRRCALGKLTVMVVPLSGPLSTSIFPPCALTIAWIIVIPKPCPSVFVV